MDHCSQTCAIPGRRALPVLSVLIALSAAGVQAQSPASADVVGTTRALDSSRVASTVTSFHSRLEAGDSAGVLELLSPDARILEGGTTETRAQYASHHLAGDIAAARALDGTHAIGKITVLGNAAWVVSTYTTRGTWRERPVDSEGAELMVLRRDGDTWRVAAIHWSSRSRRPPAR